MGELTPSSCKRPSDNELKSMNYHKDFTDDDLGPDFMENGDHFRIIYVGDVECGLVFNQCTGKLMVLEVT